MRRIAVFLLVSLLLACPVARAVAIDPGQDLGAVPLNPGTGLSGSFYKFTSGANIGTLAQANILIGSAGGSTATFTTSSVCFPDCAGRSFADTSSLTNLLNGHVSNFSYTVPTWLIPTNVSDSAMVVNGYISIAQAGTYNFNLGSDDGSQLTIGNQIVISNDNDHGFLNDTGSATFAVAGLYAINVLFFEDAGSTGLDLWASDATGTCIIGRAAGCAAGTVATNLFYLTLPASTVPEPNVIVIFATGLAGLIWVRGRRDFRAARGWLTFVAKRTGPKLAFVLIASALLASNMARAVTIGTDQNVGSIPMDPGTGLLGNYYKFNIGYLTSLAQATQLIASSGGPTATFTTTSICFPNCNFSRVTDSTTNLAGLLNGNVSNFAYAVPASQIPVSLEHSAMTITGYIAISQAGTYNFDLASDDGSQLTIGNQVVIASTGMHSLEIDTGAATFATAGLYAIDIQYFENASYTGLEFWATNNAGACLFGRSQDCTATASTGQFYSAIATSAPEPGTLTAFAVGLAGLVWGRNHRRPVVPQPIHVSFLR